MSSMKVIFDVTFFLGILRMNKWYIGIDPGWTNLGYSLINDATGEILTGHLVPADLPIGSTPDILLGLIRRASEEAGGEPIHPVRDILWGSMERFVYYKGVHNPDSENILMVTGQLQHFFYVTKTPVKMHRAIEWKNFLLRHLFKNFGFTNPNANGVMDKIFSISAAEFIAQKVLNSDYVFDTDHEADAFCLAYMSKLSHFAANQ